MKDILLYKEIFNEVKDYLEKYGGEDDDRFIFRKRSEHIWRVFAWAERLAEDCAENINREALLTAALFHDIGYRFKRVQDHGVQGALIFKEYAEANNYEKNQREFIEYLISNHSRKDMLFDENIAMELVYLLEADILDETGALGVIWDGMVCGSGHARNYTEAYNHILKYSSNIINENPMRTAKAKKIWEDKQRLVKEFAAQLKYDLAIDE